MDAAVDETYWKCLGKVQQILERKEATTPEANANNNNVMNLNLGVGFT